MVQETKHITQTTHLHTKMARGKGKAALCSNLFAQQSTVKGDRMRPNNGKLSEIALQLKSNMSSFTETNLTLTEAGCKQSSNRILANSMICFNAAALNYCFLLPLLSNLVRFQLEHRFIRSLLLRIAFFSSEPLQQTVDVHSLSSRLNCKFCLKHLFYLL